MSPSGWISPSWKMAVERILLLVLIISVPRISVQSPRTNVIKNECTIDVGIKPAKTLRSSISMMKPSYVLQPESSWYAEGKDFGCVCYNKGECSVRYCPSPPENIDFDDNCETGFHIKEHYGRTSTDGNSPVTSSVYSVEELIRRVVVRADVYRMKRIFAKCNWTNDFTLSKNYSGVLSRQRERASHHPQQMNISTMYNVNTSYCSCSGDDLYIYTPLCYKIELDSTAEIRSTKASSVFAHVGIIVSIPFLLITLIVYSVLPEMRNIHGLTLRGYVGCLLTAYTSMALSSTAKSHIMPCLCFAYIRYFSFLGSFFWQNVMCFDIWWTFGGFRSLRGSSREPDREKFLKYSIYAWGCASLSTGICVMTDYAPYLPDDLIRPDFGVEGLCWFNSKDAEALYFYGPMGATVAFNLFFFVSTIVKITRQKKDTARDLEGTDSKRHHDNKQWLNLYLKLFIIMGINWTMWIITWRFEDLKHYIWYITESGNEFQGVIIFFIFICKKNVQRYLCKRFGSRLPNSLTQDSTISRHHSTGRNTCTTSVLRSQ